MGSDVRPVVLGVDGTRTGWVGVRWDGRVHEALFAPDLAGLCTLAGTVAVVAVDMPIGLSDVGRRRCDDLVRPLLGPRRSSLFSPPALGAIDLADYAAANAWSRAHCDRGISKQAWMLVPKIREVRALEADARVPLFETFPELAFAAMQGDRPMTHPKRTWTGLRSRIDLLAEHGLALPADVGPAGAVAADDLVDAAALAWSAMRIARGEARCQPEPPVRGEASIWW